MSKLLSGCFTSIFGSEKTDRKISDNGYFQFKSKLQVAKLKPRIYQGTTLSHKLNKLDIAVQCMPPSIDISSAQSTMQSFTTKKFHIRYTHLPSIKEKPQIPFVRSEINLRNIQKLHDGIIMKEGRASNIDFMTD